MAALNRGRPAWWLAVGAVGALVALSSAAVARAADSDDDDDAEENVARDYVRKKETGADDERNEQRCQQQHDDRVAPRWLREDCSGNSHLSCRRPASVAEEAPR